MFANIVWPPKLANIISMENACLAIRWQSWQTFLETKKLANILPLKGGGLKKDWRTIRHADSHGNTNGPLPNSFIL